MGVCILEFYPAEEIAVSLNPGLQCGDLIIDFIGLLLELQPDVLDSRVNRGSELSPYHYQVVSCIRWKGEMQTW